MNSQMIIILIAILTLILIRLKTTKHAKSMQPVMCAQDILEQLDNQIEVDLTMKEQMIARGYIKDFITHFTKIYNEHYCDMDTEQSNTKGDPSNINFSSNLVELLNNNYLSFLNDCEGNREFFSKNIHRIKLEDRLDCEIVSMLCEGCCWSAATSSVARFKDNIKNKNWFASVDDVLKEAKENKGHDAADSLIFLSDTHISRYPFEDARVFTLSHLLEAQEMRKSGFITDEFENDKDLNWLIHHKGVWGFVTRKDFQSKRDHVMGKLNLFDERELVPLFEANGIQFNYNQKGKKIRFVDFKTALREIFKETSNVNKNVLKSFLKNLAIHLDINTKDFHNPFPVKSNKNWVYLELKATLEDYMIDIDHFVDIKIINIESKPEVTVEKEVKTIVEEVEVFQALKSEKEFLAAWPKTNVTQERKLQTYHRRMEKIKKDPKFDKTMRDIEEGEGITQSLYKKQRLLTKKIERKIVKEVEPASFEFKVTNRPGVKTRLNTTTIKRLNEIEKAMKIIEENETIVGCFKPDTVPYNVSTFAVKNIVKKSYKKTYQKLKKIRAVEGSPVDIQLSKKYEKVPKDFCKIVDDETAKYKMLNNLYKRVYPMKMDAAEHVKVDPKKFENLKLGDDVEHIIRLLKKKIEDLQKGENKGVSLNFKYFELYNDFCFNELHKIRQAETLTDLEDLNKKYEDNLENRLNKGWMDLIDPRLRSYTRKVTEKRKMKIIEDFKEESRLRDKKTKDYVENILKVPNTYEKEWRKLKRNLDKAELELRRINKKLDKIDFGLFDAQYGKDTFMNDFIWSTTYDPKATYKDYYVD